MNNETMNNEQRPMEYNRFWRGGLWVRCFGKSMRPIRRMPTPLSIDPEFEKQYAAFQKLLPELLKEHRGDWVGIVNEQAAVFGATRSAALAEVCNRFGDVPMCIQEVREKPRIYKIESPRLVRGLPSCRLIYPTDRT
nr:hypothetical protein [Chloroflexota bacterium]